ncbi:flippase [uncultured Lamprocystis sp.]|jgi:O-antigen/teichoic acid export membrane protein|uniref:flippase n=1 Tax=uncultured Lamprocystis sp. TaxID=543132 RepID=UPI0025EBF2F4|nr:flippase [uncultured Lamprocystis sp.]
MSIRRDTCYNLSGQLIPLAITLITLPTFLALIGESRYGMLAIVWVLLGYMGLFDLGMSRATAQRVAQLDLASPAERSTVVWTALIAITAMGLVCGLSMWTVGHLVLSKPTPVDALQVELYAALPWIALALPITMSASALVGALQGREQFLSLNVVQVVVASLALVLPLAVAVAGYTGLGWLIPATLAPRVLGILLLFGLCRRHVPLTRQPAFDAGLLRSLLGYGGWITVTAVVGPLLAVADRLIIGKVLGASAVTFYTIPHGLVSRGVMLAGSLSAAIFPRFAACTRSDRDDLMSRALAALAVVMTPVVFMAIWFVDPFFGFWLGPDIASRSAPVAQVLLLGLWFNSLAYVPYARLQGGGECACCCRGSSGGTGALCASALGFAVGLGYLWGGRRLDGARGCRCAIVTTAQRRHVQRLFAFGGTAEHDPHFNHLRIQLSAVVGDAMDAVCRFVRSNGVMDGTPGARCVALGISISPGLPKH